MIGEPRICAYCGEEFVATTGNRKYCSKECSLKAQTERQMEKYWEEKAKRERSGEAKEPTVKKCAFCGAEFMPENGSQKYCCSECQTKAAYRKKTSTREHFVKECRVCGKKFETTDERRAFCCGKCANEWILIQREMKKQKVWYCAECGKIVERNSPTQKYCSDECRRAALAEYKRKYKRKEEAKEKGVAALNRLAREAVEHHMSYGKYIEWLENGMNERRA